MKTTLIQSDVVEVDASFALEPPAHVPVSRHIALVSDLAPMRLAPSPWSFGSVVATVLCSLAVLTTFAALIVGVLWR